MYKGEGKYKTTARKWTQSATKVRGLVKDMNARALTEGKPVAWVMLSMINELFVAMDVLPVYPENYASVCATKRVGDPFMERAEADGYSNVICSYARTGLGYAALCQDTGAIPDFAPDGGMAKPLMLIGSSFMCDARYKWFQAFSRYLDAPCYNFDMPIPPAGRARRPDAMLHYLNYMLAQLRGLIAFMEETLGRKMDWDRLDEVVRRSEKTYALMYDSFILAAYAEPCPMPAEDTFNNFVPAFFMSGSVEALEFYKGLYDEVKQRLDNKVGTIPEEKYRLIWGGGIPPWHTMDIFNYVEDRGGVFVYQTSYQPFAPVEVPDSITDPLMRMFIMRSRPAGHQIAKERGMQQSSTSLFGSGALSPIAFVEPFNAQGVVMSMLRSCRNATIGQLHQRRLLKERSPVPVLILDSDMCDVRDHSEGEWKTKLDAFLETLEARKKAGG
jgi:benzoyl-CoA reductase/2-hydroxyglutaryl-CoA dehydratase subunit BcrC/BadD/HgdB